MFGYLRVFFLGGGNASSFSDQEPFSQTDIDAINEHWEMRALGVWNSVDLSGFCFKPMLVGYYCHLPSGKLT